MDKYLEKLAAAPLANAVALNLPQGKLPPRARSRIKSGDLDDLPKLKRSELMERKQKETTAKQDKLLDYYATVDVPAERVAQHVGLYRTVEKGFDEETRRPIMEQVLDVERAAAQLAWRRKQAK